MIDFAPIDAFIGRSAELEEIERLLASGTRLLTLVGPPGMGKTRLALEYLRRLDLPRASSRARERVYCAVSEARDARSFCALVTTALGLTPVRRPRKPASPERALGPALAGRGAVLLVIDNFEQLVPSSASLLETWLKEAPELEIVVTSRERLRIAPERTLELSSLSLPRAAAATEPCESVQLFVERARAAQSTFSLQQDQLPTLARVVEKLQGIPLAIELAAARTNVLSLVELDARLPENLDVLAHGKRNAPPRQATLRGAVQWSWDLLDAIERRALIGAAVFRGGFTLTAAEAVLGQGAHEPKGARVLNSVQSLRDKSLLYDAAPHEPTPRFDLYVGIREFAEERLAKSSEARDLHARHARYFIEHGRKNADELERTGGSPAASWLFRERANLLAAHTHVWRECTEKTAESAQAAVQAVLALEAVLTARGPVELLLELLDDLLEHPMAAYLEGSEHARALAARAKAAQLHGQPSNAERDLLQALALARSRCDDGLVGRLLTELGVLYHRRRHIEQARLHYEQAFAIHRQLGERRQRARTLANLGALHHDLAELERADTYYAQALAQFRVLDEPRWEGIFLTNRAILEQELGKFDAARAHYAQAVDRLSHCQDRRLLGITYGNMGILAHESGDLALAESLHLRALEELRRVGDVSSQALCHARLAGVLAEQGLRDAARLHLAAAEHILETSPDDVASAALQLSYAFLELATPNSPGSYDRIEKYVHRAKQPLGDDERSAADLSDDVRSTLRILQRALREVEPRQQFLNALPADALAVGPDGMWFRPPGGSVQDLSKFGAIRRLLQALVAERMKPSLPELSLDALWRAGWPNERVDVHSAANRVHVALADLRKRGLRTWLRRSELGYRLDPDLSIRFIDRPLP